MWTGWPQREGDRARTPCGEKLATVFPGGFWTGVRGTIPGTWVYMWENGDTHSKAGHDLAVEKKHKTVSRVL